MSGGGSKRGGGGRGGSGSKRGSTARAKSSRIARRNSQNGSGKRNSSNNNSSKDPIVTTKLVKSYRKIQPDQDYGNTKRNEVGSKTVIRDYKKVSHLELAADVDDRLSADNVSLNYSTMEYVPDLSEHYGGSSSSSDDDDDEKKGGEEENDDSDSSISVVSMAQYVSPFSADRAARNQPPLPGEDLVVDQGQPIKTPLGYNVVARAAYKPPLPEAASYFPPPLPDTAFKPTESVVAETIDVKEPPPLTKSSFAWKIGSHAYGRLGMQQAAPVLLIHMGRPGKSKKKWLRTYKVARKKTGEKYPLRLDDFDLGPAVPEGKYFEGLTWPNPRPPPEAENRLV